jgi:hypothetical protein
MPGLWRALATDARIQNRNGNLRDTLVANRTIVDPLDRVLQLRKAELQSGGARKKHMLVIGPAILGCPFGRRFTAVGGYIGTFWVDQKPHRIEFLRVAGKRSLVSAIEFAQTVLEAWFIRSPFAGEENEAKEHHTLPKDGDEFERLFENDVDVAMHTIRICNPPEIYPISVDLYASQHTELLEPQK